MSKSSVRKNSAKPAPPARGVTRMTSEAECDLIRRLWQLETRLRNSVEVEKALSSALRLSLDFFGASEGCVAVSRPGHDDAEVRLPSPASAAWDRRLLAEFLRGEKVAVPADMMLARVRRFDRMWGALVIRAPGAEFEWDARKAFSSIGTIATQIIERMSDERLREVRARIDHKIIEQIAPKDLFYQILHGLRSLIGYDHSAALLIAGDEQTTLEIVGEQIAWRKAKSLQIGTKLPLDKSVHELLSREVVYGFEREGGRSWRGWNDSDGAALARLLDYNRDRRELPTASAENAMLCAPLVTRHGVLGVLKVAAVHPGTFGDYEARILSQFLPQVAVALQNLRRTESLEQRMRAAERKQAMADLARAVSHDINNAIGAVMPLVQQLRDDLQTGAFVQEVAATDLAEIEQSLQLCRRIFGGMLGFARGAARRVSEVYLHHELDGTLGVFREGLERQGIRVAVDVRSDLPPLVGNQGDIDQLLLNLLANARDATQSGGEIAIRANLAGDRLELSISDNGCGISPELMRKIQEPFFTTKSSGNGLGLSICRSIVAQMRGRMEIESAPDVGTTVRINFPLASVEALA